LSLIFLRIPSTINWKGYPGNGPDTIVYESNNNVGSFVTGK